MCATETGLLKDVQDPEPFILLFPPQILFNHFLKRLFFLLAMKNNSDKKFSYQELPVSLKLIYTILQVVFLRDRK